MRQIQIKVTPKRDDDEEQDDCSNVYTCPHWPKCRPGRNVPWNRP